MKFFNSIRHKVIGSGFGKYLLYAFGEIILVVIGILLAIYINNRYEKKDIARKNLESVQKIYQQMQVDSINVANYIKYLDDLRQSIQYLVASEEDRKKKKLKKPLSDVSRLELFVDRDSEYINLSNLVSTQIQNGDFSSTDYAQLLFTIQVDYSNDLRAIHKQEEVIQENNQRFNAYLADHVEWYLEWSSNLNCNQDCMNFVRSDKRFNGMLALYSYEKTVIYQQRLENFRDHLNSNLKQLRPILTRK